MMNDKDDNLDGEGYGQILSGLGRLADAIDRRHSRTRPWRVRPARRVAVRIIWGAGAAAAAAGVLIALSLWALSVVRTPDGPALAARSDTAQTQPAKRELRFSWADVNPSFVRRLAREATAAFGAGRLDLGVVGGFTLQIPSVSTTLDEQADEDGAPAPQSAPSPKERSIDDGWKRQSDRDSAEYRGARGDDRLCVTGGPGDGLPPDRAAHG